MKKIFLSLTAMSMLCTTPIQNALANPNELGENEFFVEHGIIDQRTLASDAITQCHTDMPFAQKCHITFHRGGLAQMPNHDWLGTALHEIVHCLAPLYSTPAFRTIDRLLADLNKASGLEHTQTICNDEHYHTFKNGQHYMIGGGIIAYFNKLAEEKGMAANFFAEGVPIRQGHPDGHTVECLAPERGFFGWPNAPYFEEMTVTLLKDVGFEIDQNAIRPYMTPSHEPQIPEHERKWHCEQADLPV